MKDFGFRLLVLWYRLLGATPTQAEWRARQARQRPAETQRAIGAAVERNADRRYTCVCGRLLVAGDQRCPGCGRRQLLPFGVRRALRTLGLVVPEAVPGSGLMLILMAAGFVIELKLSGGNFMQPLGAPGTSIDLGASLAELTNGPQPWRAFTYTLLHANLFHILFNTMALVQIGPLVERRFGTGRFLFGWLVGGAAAVIVPPAFGFGRIGPTVGASGAVFALMGMALVRGHLDGDTRGRFIRDVMVRWVLYSTVFGLAIGGVAHSAHFGGLAAGALLAWVVPPPDDVPARRAIGPWLCALALAGMIASLGAFVRWRAAGAPQPDELDWRLSDEWAEVRARQSGLESALDEEGRALARRGRDGTLDDAFLAEVRAYLHARPYGTGRALVDLLKRDASFEVDRRLEMLRAEREMLARQRGY